MRLFYTSTTRGGDKPQYFNTNNRSFFTKKSFITLCIAVICSFCAINTKAQNHDITIKGTEFYLNNKHFPYTGLSFFNAIYNGPFNESTEERRKWMQKFKSYGINVLRIWGQWDNKMGFVNTCPECTLFDINGGLNPEHLATLKSIITDAAAENMVIQLTIFNEDSKQDNFTFAKNEATRALESLSKELMPYRNVMFQIWNEQSTRVVDYYKIIKATDPNRLVTSAPGYSGNLGDHEQNLTLDYLSPHTSRQHVPKHWEVAAFEIEYLIHKYKKPVVDDEPARSGASIYGGPVLPTSPFDHIAQIINVWRAGGYITYHHDMFLLPYGSGSTPQKGIPDPDFSPYHKQVFEFLKQRDRFLK
jgi:hypothetical protein